MDDDLMEGDDVEDIENDEMDEEYNSDDGESLMDEDEEETSPSQITFDITLPTSHTYLWDGSECQEISGRTLHEEGAELYLPILSLPGVVLMPGQLLPLHLFQYHDIAMVKHCLDKDRTFGHVTKIYDSSNGGVMELGKIGTTAEILAVKEVHMSYRVKTIGRQRFQILEKRSDIGGVLIARVRILPEKKMTNILSEVCPNSYRKLLENGRRHEPYAIVSNNNKYKRKKFCPSVMTSWPTWIFDQYDCNLLMDKIRVELMNWNDSFDLSKVPSDPSSFSYWVASVLPLNDSMRLEILFIHSPEQRLRCELDLMKKCTVMCCKSCRESIAKQKDVFSMSTDGPLGTYVNPGGHVHETLTVHHVTGLSLQGRPSTQSSWFEGYAWTIAVCRSCSHHIGWKFTRVKNSNLKPEKFWGLCRASLVPVLEKNQNDPLPTVK